MIPTRNSSLNITKWILASPEPPLGRAIRAIVHFGGRDLVADHDASVRQFAEDIRGIHCFNPGGRQGKVAGIVQP